MGRKAKNKGANRIAAAEARAAAESRKKIEAYLEDINRVNRKHGLTLGANLAPILQAVMIAQQNPITVTALPPPVSSNGHK